MAAVSMWNFASSGGKWWRLKYRMEGMEGNERRISLGTYLTIDLKEARLRRDEAKKLLANGIDPSAQRQTTKASTLSRVADSFEAVMREWFERHVGQLAPSYAQKSARTV